MYRAIVSKPILALTLAILVAAGCAIPQPRPSVNSAEEIYEGEAVVVGRLLLDPPMGKDEMVMDLKGGIYVGKDKMRDMYEKPMIVTGDYIYEGGEIPMNEYEGYIHQAWGKYFFSAFQTGETVLRAVVYTIGLESAPSVVTNQGVRAVSTRHDKAHMPVNAVIDIKPKDEVVYIGTIKIKRDEFNSFKGIRVIDEFKKVLPALKKKYGKNVKVRKALARPEK